MRAKKRVAHRRVTWSLRIAVTVLIAIFTSPATTFAQWTAPVDVTAAGEVFDPSVAVANNSSAVFAWHRFDGTNNIAEARTLSAGRVLAQVHTLSAPGQSGSDTEVAVDANGNAIITWINGTTDSVEARTLSAANILGPLLTLSAAGGGAYHPHVAADLAGYAVVTWRQYDGVTERILARTISAAGVLGAATLTISSAGQNATDPQVAVNDIGDAALTWSRFDGTNWRAQARALSPAGVLSRVRTVSRAGQDAYDPQVAIDVNGNATVTWFRSDGTNNRVQARAISAAGVRSKVRTLSDPGASASAPQVDVDAAGNAVFTWHRHDGFNYRVQTRTVSATGVRGAVLTLSDPGQTAYSPQLAVEPGGNTVVTWHRSDGLNNRVQALSLPAAGAPGAISTLSDAGQDASYPQVGIDPTGAAVITWWHFDGTNYLIQYAAGP